jgi:hypothetical protein
MRRLAALAMLVAACTAAPLAHADGDPASDYLYTQQAFIPFDIKAPVAAQSDLHRTIAGANRGGFAIRVAIISSAYDLGAVPSLWQKPQTYARFLGQELLFVYKQRLLIVMPNGFGFFWTGHDVSKEYATLSKIRIARGGPGLLTAAHDAVTKLAAASGVDVAPAQPPKSTASRDRLIIIFGSVAIAAAALLVRAFLRRRRA